MALDNNTVVNYTDKTTIKNWFKTGLKPTQKQFWSTGDSFWHKSESLPISSISGLGNLLDGKAEENHEHNQYAKNDATSLTADNITAWQQKLGVADLKFDDKAITTTQDYADFGLQAGATINAFNNAIYQSVGNKLDAPTEEGTTTDYPYVVGVNDENEPIKLPAGDLGKNFSNTDLVVSANRKHTGTASVELAMPFICSNSSIRYSGILDKSADATYNNLLGVDSNGYAAKVGLNAVTNAMSKSTDAQKDAWRLASLKTNEKFSVGQPRIDTLLPPIVSKDVTYKQYVTITGLNLFINVHTQTSKVYLVKVKDENGIDIQPNEEGFYPTEILIDNVSVNYTMPTQLSFGLDFSLLELGFYRMRVINDSIGSVLGGILRIVPSIPTTELINPKYEYYDSVFNTLQETINAQNVQKTLTQYNTHYIKSPISFLKSDIEKLQSMVFDIGVIWSAQTSSANYRVTVGLVSNTGFQTPLVTMIEGKNYVGKSYQLGVQVQNGIASVSRFDTVSFNKSIILTDVATSYTVYFIMYTEGAGANFNYNLNLTSYYKEE